MHDHCLNPGLKKKQKQINKPKIKPESYAEHYWGSWRSLNLDSVLKGLLYQFYSFLDLMLSGVPSSGGGDGNRLPWQRGSILSLIVFKIANMVMA